MLLAFLAGFLFAVYLVGVAAVWLEETEVSEANHWSALWTALQWPWLTLRAVIRRWLGKD